MALLPAECAVFRSLLLALPLFLSPLAGYAQESGADDDFELWVIDKNIEISKKIDAAAEDLDVYAANKRYSQVPNKSRVIFHNGFSWAEGGAFKYSPHVGVRLHLPNLQ